MSRLPFTIVPTEQRSQRFDVIGLALGLAYLAVALAFGIVLGVCLLD